MVAPVFGLLFDSANAVLITQFHGNLVEADVVVRDNAVSRFVECHGLVRGIMDYTAVEAVEMSVDFIVGRATAPPLLPGAPRLIVAPREPSYSLNRVIAAHQLYSRKLEPLIVNTLDEAHRALGIANPMYQALEPDDATRLELAAFDALAGIEHTLAPAAAEREKMQRKILRLLNSAIAAAGMPSGSGLHGAITLADVLNTQLQRARLSDADLTVRCDGCGNEAALDTCRMTPGRETTYACGDCGALLLVLTAADAHSLRESYRLGRFSVRAHADVDAPGGRLPRSTGRQPSQP